VLIVRTAIVIDRIRPLQKGEKITACASARKTVVVALAALCVAVAGSVRYVDAAPAKAPKNSNSAAQLRYHGGPKAPMWRSQ
jgi:hypothetical protein